MFTKILGTFAAKISLSIPPPTAVIVAIKTIKKPFPLRPSAIFEIVTSAPTTTKAPRPIASVIVRRSLYHFFLLMNHP